MRRAHEAERRHSAGEPIPRRALAVDRVRYVGEPVAVVVARREAAAREARGGVRHARHPGTGVAGALEAARAAHTR